MANAYQHFCFSIGFTDMKHIEQAKEIYSQGYINRDTPDDDETEYSFGIKVDNETEQPVIIVHNDSGEGSPDEVVTWLINCYKQGIPLWPNLDFEYSVTTVPSRVGGFGGGRIEIDFGKQAITYSTTHNNRPVIRIFSDY